MQVREKDLSVVISTLEEEFQIVKEVEGEYMPVGCQDFTNGLQKNGKEGFCMNSLNYQPVIRIVLGRKNLSIIQYNLVQERGKKNSKSWFAHILG